MIAIAGVLCLGIGLVVGGGLLIGQVAQSEASSRVDKKLSQIQELKESRKWESAKTAADALEIELKKLDDRQGLSKLYASVAGIDKMIQILAVEDDEARLGSLLQYSGDKDAAVRMGIAWELRPFAEELDEAQSSLAVLARDADVKVAKVAQQALVQAGGPYAIPYLTAALERSPSTGDEQDDIALARTLEIDDPAVLPALLKILELRPEASPSVLRQVLGRIGEYGNAQSIPAVEPFTKHSDGEVAELAKDVIRELKA